MNLTCHRSIKIHMSTHKLFNLTISAKDIRHTNPMSQKAIDYAEKIEKEFLLVEGIQ